MLIKGTFLFKYDLENYSWLSRNTVLLEDRHIRQIVDNHSYARNFGIRNESGNLNGESGIDPSYIIGDVHYSKDGNTAIFVCLYKDTILIFILMEDMLVKERKAHALSWPYP